MTICSDIESELRARNKEDCLTLKASVRTAADDSLEFFKENKT